MVAVGLTHLTFYAVAVDGMMQLLLRNTNEHLNRLVPVLALIGHIYRSQRESSYGMALASVEECFYQFPTDYPLLFVK